MSARSPNPAAPACAKSPKSAKATASASSSLFECTVNESQLETLRLRLKKAMLPEEDNLRIYLLRGRWQDVVEAYGKDSYVNFKDLLIA